MGSAIIAVGPKRTLRAKVCALAFSAAILLCGFVGYWSVWAFLGLLLLLVLPLGAMTLLHASIRATLSADGQALKGRAPTLWGYPVTVDVAWSDLVRICTDEVQPDEEASGPPSNGPPSLDNPVPHEPPRERHVRLETRWRSVLLPTASFEISPEVIVRRLARCIDAGVSGTRASQDDIAHAKRRFAKTPWSISQNGRTLTCDQTGVTLAGASLPWEQLVAAHLIERPVPHIELECVDGHCLHLAADWGIPPEELADKVAPTCYLSEDRAPTLDAPKPTALLLDL